MLTLLLATCPDSIRRECQRAVHWVVSGIEPAREFGRCFNLLESSQQRAG